MTTELASKTSGFLNNGLHNSKSSSGRAARLTLICLSVLVISLASSIVSADEENTLATQLVNPGYQEKPAWFKNSFLDIREDIDEAASEERRVLLYFYQDGCPYCAKLVTDNFGQVDIAEKTQRYFDTIAINMWGDREVVDLQGKKVTEKLFSKEIKVQFTPTLLMLNEQGNVVIRINGCYAPHKFSTVLDYVGLKQESKIAVRDYLNQNQSEKSTGKLHRQDHYLQPPYQLKKHVRNSTRPLLVMFEQKQCRVCDELHLDILKRDDTKELLSQFDIVLFDMWSNESIQTPDGEETNAQARAASLGVHYSPTLVFYDNQGSEVFRTEGYLKSFHIQSAMDYVQSKAYLDEPEFQRYILARADKLEAQGIHVDLMNYRVGV